MSGGFGRRVKSQAFPIGRKQNSPNQGGGLARDTALWAR